MRYVKFSDVKVGEVFMHDKKYSTKVTNVFGVPQVVNLEDGIVSDLDLDTEVILVYINVSKIWR